MKYKHIFFDLDRTLWDFESNSKETLEELHDLFNLNAQGILDISAFIKCYQLKNINLWVEYAKDNISKETLRSERFKSTFYEFGVKDERLIEAFSIEYINRGPKKKKLVNFSLELLEYLNSRYTLHIITNGFNDVQDQKLTNTGIKKYFKNVITSELASSKKPDKMIFEFALKLTGAKNNESLVIGDSLEADIIGAMNCSIDQVYFNPAKDPHDYKPTYEINCLSELIKVL